MESDRNQATLSRVAFFTLFVTENFYAYNMRIYCRST